MLLRTIFSGIMAGVQRKRAKEANEKAAEELARSESFQDGIFNSQYYKDFTDRADVQALFNNFRNEQKKQTSQNRKNIAVSGGTQESVAAMQKNTADALANTYNNAASIGAQWKDSMMENYLNRKAAIQNGRYNLYQNTAASYMGSANDMLGSTSEGLASLDKFWMQNAKPSDS